MLSSEIRYKTIDFLAAKCDCLFNELINPDLYEHKKEKDIDEIIQAVFDTSFEIRRLLYDEYCCIYYTLDKNNKETIIRLIRFTINKIKYNKYIEINKNEFECIYEMHSYKLNKQQKN